MALAITDQDVGDVSRASTSAASVPLRGGTPNRAIAVT